MYSDTTNFRAKYQYVLFPYRLPEVYVEKIGDSWYYSPEVSNNIDELYNNIFPWYTEKLKQIIPDLGIYRFLNIELWQYLGLL